MSVKLKNIRRQAGDTIIEVIIATAVVGLSLAGAYVATNHQYDQLENAQLREEAVNLATSQAELMHEYNLSSINGGNFCLGVSSNTVDELSGSGCSGLGSNGLYTVTDLKTNTGSMSELATYEIQVTWSGLGGDTNSNVVLYYQPLAES